MTEHQMEDTLALSAPKLTSGRPGAARRTRVFNLGQLPYEEAYALQVREFDKKLDGEHETDALFLLEHPPTITLGRDSHDTNVLIDEATARRRGITIVPTDRGGDVTYHGPGQLVVYPIFDLRHWKTDLGAYVTALEEIVLRSLADVGLSPGRDPRSRGVWIGGRKIASVGVRVRRWVAMHGIALNVNTDLDDFRAINPCGLTAETMTTAVAEGMPIERQDELRDRIIHHFGTVFATRCELEGRHELEPSWRPPWLKAKLPIGPVYQQTATTVADQRLHTVCQSAQCPNLGECWERGTATFMINGNVCSRSCSFCAVFTGKPLAIDPHEPQRVAQAVASMGLKHAVITAVNRDELADGGASQFAQVIRSCRATTPGTAIEVLVPDFMGETTAIDAVLIERPDVFNHNVETVPRLYKRVRPQARYERSLAVLKRAADAGLVAKSGLMLGLGEEVEEVDQVLRDLKAAGVQIVTLGQYLRPSDRHLPIDRWVTPEEFIQWRKVGLAIGFAEVASGPLVRSSYHAGESWMLARKALTATNS